MSVFKNRSGFFPRLLPVLIAGGGVMFLLSGCFLFVSPDRPARAIPHAVPNDPGYYELSEEDSFSCMRIHLPDEVWKKPFPAVVIFPGGAYGVLAMDKEGHDYASFLNRHGIAGIVVKYPLGSIFGNFRRHPAMLNAARRAIRLTRYYALQLGIDPHRIGVMGSSAGGHLAGLAAVLDNASDPESPDPVEHVSARPDFAILCYPVVTMTAPCAHSASRSNLLGLAPDDELLNHLSLEKNVTPGCPPIFLWQTLEDQTVDPRNSRMLAEALKRNQVPHRARFYPHGPHGLGLPSPEDALKFPDTAKWPEEMLAFLGEIGVLNTAEMSK